MSKGYKETIFGEKSLTYSDHAVTVTGDNEQEEFKLEDIKRIEQYEDMILFYISKNSAIIIPTRQLTWDEVPC
ncbi:MAG: YcxB family protein [Alkalibacterium sp.]|nr:YcxB family protein [Alkalibacterium sp.]